MTLLRNHKKQQRKRRNLPLLGIGVGGLGLVAGSVTLARKSLPLSHLKASSIQSQPFASVQSTRISSIKPITRVVHSGAIVHVPGKGREYYPSSPLVERTVRLGKPGGRPRSRKNWNDWDYYRDTYQGAYNLRNTRRYDKGRL
jgi:hypothetical protein